MKKIFCLFLITVFSLTFFGHVCEASLNVLPKVKKVQIANEYYKKIKVKWKKVKKANFYQVKVLKKRKNKKNKFVKRVKTKKNKKNKFVKKLNSDTNYYFRIRACKKKINCGPWSKRKKGTTNEHFTYDEFQVNTYIDSYQINPSLAMDASGNFVVVWSSKNQDGDLYGIFGQRFYANGKKHGEEFQVNTYTTNNQKDPSVAMDANGDFVVTWESWYQENDGYEIYMQRYNSDGVSQGAETRINDYATSYQRDPSVSMDDDGNFAVVWQSWEQGGSDGYYFYGKLFNADGTAQGNEFQISSYKHPINEIPGVEAASDLEIQGEEEYIVVDMNADGNFVVTWANDIREGNAYEVYARQYDSNGTALGDEFQVSTTSLLDERDPEVSLNDNGAFMIVWHILGGPSVDSTIYTKKYDSNGEVVREETQLATDTGHDAGYPGISLNNSGDYVVGWESSLRDEYDTGIFAQSFDSSGNETSDELSVNQFVENCQEELEVAMDEDGNFVVVWISWGPDGLADSVQARIFSKP